LETIGRDLNEMQRVPLAESHVAALRAAGTVAHYAAGTFLVQSGDRVDRFVYVEDGEIEVVNPFTDERHVPSTLGPNQFMGEMSLLNGGAWSVPMRAVCDTRVIEVPRSAMLGLMSEIPEMSDIIITVLAARRRRQLDVGYGTLVLIGEDADRDVRRIADFLSRSRLPYASYAVGSREAERVASVSGVAADRPAVIFGRGQVLTEPTPEKVGGNINGMIKAAEANVAAATDETIVIPGHGQPVSNKAELFAYRDMLVTIRENIAKLKQQGRPLDDIIDAKPTAAFDAKWGQFVIDPAFFTRLVFKGV
jgi:CRP-like cAMP-binding protein